MGDYSELCTMLVFKSHADACVEALSRLTTQVYAKDFSLYDALQGSFHPQLVSWFEHLTMIKQIAPDDRVGLANLFSEMNQFLNETEVLMCTFSYSPRAVFYKTLYSHVVASINSQRILLDVMIDPAIIGGAVYSYKGRHYNFTLAFDFKQSLQQG